MKTCNKCETEKPLEDFYRHPKTRDGRTPTCKHCSREYRNRKARECPEAVMLKGARFRAKKEGLPFDLTVGDLSIPDTCPVLGTPMSHNWGTAGHDGNSPSLDRIVPALGYVKGNVAVISLRANRMKSDASLDELRKLVQWMEKQEPTEGP